jgi:VanZ family protein
MKLTMKWLALRILLFSVLAAATLLFVAHGRQGFSLVPGLAPVHFLLLWGAFLAVLLVPHLYGVRFFPRLVLVVLMILILSGALTTRSFRYQVVSQVREQVHTLAGPEEAPRTAVKAAPKPPVPARSSRPDVKTIRTMIRANKTGHFILFGLLTFSLLAVAARAGLRWIALADVLLLAGSTELMQFFLQGRTAGLHDFFLDAAGAALGLVLWTAYVLFRWWRPPRRL